MHHALKCQLFSITTICLYTTSNELHLSLYYCLCVDTSESDGNTLGSEVRHTSEAGQVPPSSPEVAHCLEEAKRRARELREKAGQWTRRLTLVHTLTMHTAMSRKDNDTPAAVTSLCISRCVTYL